jgi:hypothetical protein
LHEECRDDGDESTYETPHAALDLEASHFLLDPQHLVPQVLLHLLAVVALVTDLAGEAFDLRHH